MFNLNDIIQNAQGGQAIGNLARQFGLSPQQAQAAVSSLLPGLSMGINNAAQSPGGLGGILGQLLNGANTDAFHHPVVAATTGAQHGGDILGQVLGGGHMQPQVQPQGAGGGIGDLLGSIFGGGAQAQQQPQGGGLGGALGNMFPQGSQQPGLQGQAMQLGLETLSKMFQHGTQVATEHQSGLQDIFAQMLGGKR